MSNSNFLEDPTSKYIISEQYAQTVNGVTETPLQVFERVGREVASVEVANQDIWAETFTNLHVSGDFCGGGRILAGAGSPHGNLLNCFTQGALQNPPDSFEGIMELAMKLALVTKVGGGNGVNLDELGNCKYVLKRVVKGYVAMDVTHPDIESFIKGEMTDITKYGSPRVIRPLKILNKVVLTTNINKLSEEQLNRFKTLCLEYPEIIVGTKTEVSSLIKPVVSITVEDSIVDIMVSAKSICKTAQLGKTFLIDVSDLRPENSYIAGSGGTSSGPYSFVCEIFDHFAKWISLGGHTANPVDTLRYIYAPVLRVVRQGGSRRGAGMATMLVSNPSAMNFLTCKDLDREESEGEIGTFNISLLVTDDFIKSLKLDDYVRDSSGLPVLYKFNTNLDSEQKVTKLKARDLWLEIAKHAHSTGEPGIIFVDRINKHSALLELSKIDSKYWINKTNPCGEIPLTTGEPCDLGAINWANFVTEDKKFDSVRFRKIVQISTRFLDNVLDVNKFALEDNRLASQSMRRLGLGMMGLADALIKMGLAYDSQEALDQASQIASFQASVAQLASQELARIRGCFPLMLEFPDQFKHIIPRRNVAGVTGAPTGTTSMVLAVSSGIEPIYSLVTYRKVGGKSIKIIHPLFNSTLNDTVPVVGGKYTLNNQWNWELILEDLNNNHGSIQNLDFPEYLKKLFKTAHDISPEYHVKMQGAVQKGFDQSNCFANSLSKTINLSEETTVEDIQAAYNLAITEQCKGITVYRNNSRAMQVINTSKLETKSETNSEVITLRETVKRLEQELSLEKEKTKLNTASFDKFVAEKTGELSAREPRVRPDRLFGLTQTCETSDGKLYLTINYDTEGPREVVVNLGKGGGVLNSLVEAIGRLISISLQYHIPFSEIIHKLRGIRGGHPYGFGSRQILSIPDAIGKVLSEVPNNLISVSTDDSELHKKVEEQFEAHKNQQFLNLDTVETTPIKSTSSTSIKPLDPVKDLGKNPECPDCGTRLMFEEGCQRCPSCLTSKCG